jgi:hypothetical protein
MEFSKKLTPVLTICFVGAPILLLISSLFEGLVEDNIFKQGVLGQYGGILLTGVNLTLAFIIGKRKATLGLFSIIVGTIGGIASAAGYMVMYSFDIASSIHAFNSRELMIQLTESPDPKMFIGGVIGLFVPISFILNGIGLLVSKVEPKVSAIFLILAGLGFFIGQGIYAISAIISPIFMALGLISLWIRIQKSGNWTEY